MAAGALLGAGVALASTLGSGSGAAPVAASTHSDTPAATRSARPDPPRATSPRSPSPRPTPTVAAALGAPGSPAPGRAKAGCAGPAACGFPDASTTGPRTAPSSGHSGNISIRDDGTVISGWNLTGSLDIYADNVTVIDSRISTSNWWGVNLRPGHTGLRILHTYITGVPGRGPDNGGEDYAVSNMSEGTVEIGWSDLSVMGNTVSTGHGYIHDDYVHGLVPFIARNGNYEHTDTVISEGGDTGGLRIEHNTLLNPIDVNHGASSVIGLYADSGAVTDATIKDNWMAGGAYALYAGGATSARIVVSGNVFSDEYWPECGYYGAITYWNPSGSGNVWSGNTFRDGAAVAPS
ncbi:hypothetical protein KGA66_23820 [Actinocrinis puniceicyclus]|uniref:Right handed beta helix domain-containing protein n=1 Tax=Actinocrinis puniceicyclus TaxID=977794 RepID=A0A8J7WVW2_9ACTN|nr:hypothetical protein [Actinocrinis puniceicyclus]MBS2966094.1 hypothetical protein [Actinocrinis puniceicyclus]